MGLDIITILNYLGITHDRILPFVLLTAEMIYISYRSTNPIKVSIDSIKVSMVRMKNAIIEMQTIFAQNGTMLQHHLIEASASPLAPTEYGSKFIHDSGLERILNERSFFLKTELSKRLPENHTKYDVQENARSLLVDLKNNEITNPVKNYAFERGINVDIILRAGGLWLRDDFLGEKRAISKIKEGD